jgi:hypothetical protein
MVGGDVGDEVGWVVRAKGTLADFDIHVDLHKRVIEATLK